MALVEQTMTEKNLEAHRRNGRQSHGAATPEGKERARAANLRHGYYSEVRDQALVALGEDPADLAALVEGVRQQFRPANGCQEWITSRLASLQFRMQRAERQQESKMANHIRQFEARRREAARQLRAEGADVQGFLGDLQHAVARPDFYAPNGCCRAVPGRPAAAPEPAAWNKSSCFCTVAPAALLHQSGAPAPARGHERPGVAGRCECEMRRTSRPFLRDPEIPVAEGNDRDPLREQLWRLAAEELRLATEQWQKAVAAQEAPLSPRSRDLLALEVSKELELMRREERSCFREFARLIRDLMKLQKESEVRRPKSEGKPQGESEVQGPKPEAADHHPRPPVPSPATHDAVIGETAAVAPAMAAVQAQNTGAEDGTEKNVRKNEGASGYVEENTGNLNSDGATANAQPTTHPAAEAHSLPDNLTEANTATPATVVIGLLPSNIRPAA